MVENASILSPTSDSDKTPYEMFHGVKPKIDHLRTIGCTAYVHIPPKTRKWKFAPSAKITRLVGYSDIRKAYRVVDSNHKIFDARDITFNETENLAGQKGFPGPDAVILGMHDEETPIEPDEDDTPPSELKEKAEYDARMVRYKKTQEWGSPEDVDVSYMPSSMHQQGSIPPQNSAQQPNNTVEQGNEHNPGQSQTAKPPNLMAQPPTYAPAHASHETAPAPIP